jgi:formylglycine-generating enzyme required for sulfatase activity
MNARVYVLPLLFLAATRQAAEKSKPPLAKAPFDAATAKKHQQVCAKFLGQPVEITNSIGMKLVLIPPGEFMMGSGESAESLAKEFGMSVEAFAGDYPQHRVRITKPLYLGTYEVTQTQYERMMGSNPSYFSADGEGKRMVTRLEAQPGAFLGGSATTNDPASISRSSSEAPAVFTESEGCPRAGTFLPIYRRSRFPLHIVGPSRDFTVA